MKRSMHHFWRKFLKKYHSQGSFRFDTLLLTLLLFLLIISVFLVLNPLKRGLHVSYYDNTTWEGTPFKTKETRSVKLRERKQQFPAIRRNYSIDWTGILFIPKSGEYEFITVSDDGSDLYIDDKQVVSNGGFHGRRERSGRLHLNEGFHAVKIRYMQGGGAASLKVLWKKPGQRTPSSIPKSSLFLERPSRKAFWIGRCMGFLSILCLLLGILAIVGWVTLEFLSGRCTFPVLTRSAIAGIIFLVVFVTHFFLSDMMTLYDSKWSIPTTLSILREGNTDLDEYEPILRVFNDYSTEQVDNHTYTVYPPGPSIMAIPIVFLVDEVLDRGLSVDLVKFLNTYACIPGGIETAVASIIVALSSVLMFLTATKFFTDKFSPFVLACILAFCTSSWSTASRALWQHGPSMLLLVSVLYLLIQAERCERHQALYIRLSGLLLAFSFLVRPTNCISIVICSLYILVHYRKHFLPYCLYGVSIGVLFCCYSLSVYHAILPPYYLKGSQLSGGFSFSLVEGLAGTLISPSRGVFIFSPILFFSFYGIFLKMRAKEMKGFDYGLLAIVVLHWIVSSAHPHWWGGHSYGPRYFTEMMPFLLYFIFPVFAHIPKLCGMRKIFVVFLLCCSIAISGFIHYRGATSKEVYGWNGGPPADVDAAPDRVWDWSDIQFLRGL